MKQSKSIKKKLSSATGFSKSPKLVPQMPVGVGDFPEDYMMSNSQSGISVKDNKKGKLQANLMRMRKDSMLSEKEKRKIDIRVSAQQTS
jgi:hypothetical protein